MLLEQLDYDLPAELIAQQPVEPRDSARLLVLNRATGTIEHFRFWDLVDLLSPEDCLVLNDTRVLAARLVGRREATGGRWEGLFLGQQASSGLWELLCQTGGRPQPGELFGVQGGRGRLVLRARTAAGHWLMQPDPAEEPESFLGRCGHVPLPHYIRGGEDEPADRNWYQTVYADQPGAVAAPTAGLHITSQLLDRLRSKGIEIVRLTLHVGLGTFQPVRHSLAEHRMHAEKGRLSGEAVQRILARRERGGRTVAVGTTSVRVLETAAQRGALEPWAGETSIFIYPPYQFRAVDALVTNFHLPRTTLLALVFAFAGEELGRRAYATAIEQRYRFYSFGDAMLIL